MKDLALDLYLLGGLAAGAGVLTLLGMLVAWGAKKIKWQSVRAVTLEAWEMIAVVTKEANAELVAQLKAARAEDSDGGAEITKAEWDAAKKAAVAKFKKLWGLENLGRLAAALGLSSSLLDDWIGANVAGNLELPQ